MKYLSRSFLMRLILERIVEVKNKYQDKLFELEGVVGVGIGGSEENKKIKVLVSSLTDELSQKIPEFLEGFEVIIEKVGDIKAY